MALAVRISEVTVVPITMPKVDRTWRFALAATAETFGFVVRIDTDEGVVGIGYTTVAEHIGADRAGVERGLHELGVTLVGRDPANLVARLEELSPLAGRNTHALAGLDLALHDLAARALGIPLHRLLGGSVRDRVPLLRILSIKAPAEMAAVAGGLADEGYRYLKIKVEGDAAADLARVRAIRERVGPAVHLTIDANQSYTADGAIRAIVAMEPFGIDLVEQPVPADDLAGLARVSAAVETPVEADESARTLGDVYRLVSERIVDSVSLKLPKLGGIRAAQAAAAICAAGGVRCRMGAAVGSRLLSAAALHFMAATPAVSYAAELAEFARLLDDPAVGLEVERGELAVPTGIGVGVRLRDHAMEVQA